ncbi:peptide chain release factor N(5)-glutamine methyltransferase [Weeksellaceae bacterium KMM 9713]|uniref:peptide chain release factor N(5)-glutamine methyltransferase n=1 Tax=Profundicola chukchiensis TaxID=2961959 RepID=A0A9X4RXD8_9FLAO|nr:peptide chain release factor N(5)-glutamine methyltransferase [Profundicola chukchiensis]MDG4946199.1 peptide chain release factor N(5)-glutamine methyltransferase [Profundicola chukchiensis]
MTIQDIRDKFQERLSELYTKDEIDTIFFSLAETHLRKDKNIIRAGLHESWPELKDAEKHFDFALTNLMTGTPFQYVMGETQFMDHKLFVNPNVLIPRPETEELAEWIIQDYTNPNNEFDGNILDIGTGSGALAIALKAAFPKASVHALDISPEALEVAKNNAMYNHTKINFHEIDILNTFLDDLPYFDIIVSNPPYIPSSEKAEMQEQVSKHEPEIALFVPDEDPTVFYNKINQLALDKLKPKAAVYLEIHQNLMEETKKIFEFSFGKVNAKKDISNNWRMLKVQQPFTCK